jgi:hypothetical protein
MLFEINEVNSTISILMSGLSPGFECGFCSADVYLVFKIFSGVFLLIMGLMLLAIRNKRAKTYFNQNYRIILIVINAILLMFMLFNSITRYMDGDEGEHIHAAWYISEGKVPYVDFFEHHHMILNYLIALSIKLIGETIVIFYLWRLIVFILSMILVYFTYKLGKRFFNEETALIGTILLLTTTFFFSKVIEIRPDVPQALFGVISIYYFMAFYDYRKLRDIALSGIFLSISFLFLQKSIFLAGILFLILFYSCFIKKSFEKKGLYVFSLAVIITLIPYYIYILATGQFYKYYIYNLIFNLKYTDSFSVLCTLIVSLIQNSFLWIFALVGGYKIIKKENASMKIILSVAILLLVSLITIKNPFRQYFLGVLPLVALIGGYGMFNIIKKIDNKIFAVLIVILAISIPLLYLIAESTVNNLEDIAKAKYLINNTSPSDYVYDPLTFNFFRKDIDFMWFNPGYGVETLNKIFPYHYNVYDSIEKYTPKVISTADIDLNNTLVKQEYVKTKYVEFFIRK